MNFPLLKSDSSTSNCFQCQFCNHFLSVPLHFLVMITVDLVIFACLNFRAFMICGLLTKFRICEFLFFFSSPFIIIIFKKFVLLAKFAKIKTSRILLVYILITHTTVNFPFLKRDSPTVNCFQCQSLYCNRFLTFFISRLTLHFLVMIICTQKIVHINPCPGTLILFKFSPT